MTAWQRHALLTCGEMYAADQAAVLAGVPSQTLMANAGAAVARIIRRRWKPMPALVLCGPGNNGGDGFVVAEHLRQAGWPVRLGLLGRVSDLRGDAAWAAGNWQGATEPLAPELISEGGPLLIVDALFGAGISRPLDGAAAGVIEAANGMTGGGQARLAVDVPSGIHGDTGQLLGAAFRADVTVTFFRMKPGHLLMPGRVHCGETVVGDIGIPPLVLREIDPQQAANRPALWRDALPAPDLQSHKYMRGHVLIRGGPMSGAGCLAAMGAARAGAGMVSLMLPAAAPAPGLAAAVIQHTANDPDAFAERAADPRIAALVVGPGNGRDGAAGRATFNAVQAALKSGRPVVLDADALAAPAELLFEAIRAAAGPVVLTPHAGEFARLFGVGSEDLAQDKLRVVRQAADTSGAVVVLKGGDTVIAAPEGLAVINDNAPPWLATAGAGDVLAGMTGALLGQGMPAFLAATAAVWLHGAAARVAGPALIADDLPGRLTQAFAAAATQ